MKWGHPTLHQIELRLGTLSELFNSMDPPPLHHRYLDRDAVETLVNRALVFPQASHSRIIVHIAQMPKDDPTALVSEAMRNDFDDRSTLASPWPPLAHRTVDAAARAGTNSRDRASREGSRWSAVLTACPREARWLAAVAASRPVPGTSAG